MTYTYHFPEQCLPHCPTRTAIPIMNTTRSFTMLSTVIANLPDLSLPDTFDFDLTLHVHVQR